MQNISDSLSHLSEYESVSHLSDCAKLKTNVLLEFFLKFLLQKGNVSNYFLYELVSIKSTIYTKINFRVL